jgi:hypothetical protein
MMNSFVSRLIAISGMKIIGNNFQSGHISTPQDDNAVRASILEYLKSAKNSGR